MKKSAMILSTLTTLVLIAPAAFAQETAGEPPERGEFAGVEAVENGQAGVGPCPNRVGNRG